ncbi:secreted protein, partial [sediment metagenome]
MKNFIVRLLVILGLSFFFSSFLNAKEDPCKEFYNIKKGDKLEVYHIKNPNKKITISTVNEHMGGVIIFNEFFPADKTKRLIAISCEKEVMKEDFLKIKEYGKVWEDSGRIYSARLEYVNGKWVYRNKREKGYILEII